VVFRETATTFPGSFCTDCDFFHFFAPVLGGD